MSEVCMPRDYLIIIATEISQQVMPDRAPGSSITALTSIDSTMVIDRQFLYYYRPCALLHESHEFCAMSFSP